MRNLWFCPATKANFSFFPTCRLFKIMFQIILINPKWIKTRLTFPQLLSIICSSVPNCLSKSKQVRGKWENREQVSAKAYLLTSTGKKHQHQLQRQFLFIHLTEQEYHNRITSVGWAFCLLVCFFLSQREYSQLQTICWWQWWEPGWPPHWAGYTRLKIRGAP